MKLLFRLSVLIALIIGFSVRSYAAITLLHATTDNSFSGGGTATYSLTVDASTDFLEIQWISYASVYNISSVVWNGVTMTQLVASTLTVDTGEDAAIYGLAAPATGTHNLVINFSPNCPYGGAIVEKDWSGVDQTTPVDNTAGINPAVPASPQTLSITVSAGGVASDVVNTGGATPIVDGSQTEDFNSTAGGDHFGSSHKASASAMTWTWMSSTPSALSHVIIALKVASSCTPDHLTITTQPSSSTFAVGVGMVVASKDSGGTTCTSDNSTSITVSSHSGSPCSTLTSGTNLTKTVSSGVATWASADLTTALNGTACTIDASDSGALTDATSSAFTICQQGSGVDYCGVHGHAASANTNSVTVTVTTTGSTALAGYCAYGNTGGMVGHATFSDGDMQTWTALTPYQGTGVDDEIMGFYIENPTVGASKTYTCTTTAQFPAICLIGITGTTTSIFRAENGGGTSGAAMTLSPGNVTVTATDIVTTALSVNAIAGTVTIDDSFIISDHQAYVAATNYGLDCGFKTGDSGTVGPAWSWGNSVNASGTNDVFKVGTVTASTSRMTLLGVGR